MRIVRRSICLLMTTERSNDRVSGAASFATTHQKETSTTRAAWGPQNLKTAARSLHIRCADHLNIHVMTRDINVDDETATTWNRCLVSVSMQNFWPFLPPRRGASEMGLLGVVAKEAAPETRSLDHERAQREREAERQRLDEEAESVRLDNELQMFALEAAEKARAAATPRSPSFRPERARERKARMRERVAEYEANVAQRVFESNECVAAEEALRERAAFQSAPRDDEILPQWARLASLRVDGNTASVKRFDALRATQLSGEAGAWAGVGGLSSFASTSSLDHPSAHRLAHVDRTRIPSSAAFVDRVEHASGGRDTIQETSPHKLLFERIGGPPPFPAKRPLQKFEKRRAKKNSEAFESHRRTEGASRAAEMEERFSAMSYHRARQLHSLSRAHDGVMSRYPRKAMTTSLSYSNLSESAYLPTRTSTPPARREPLQHSPSALSFGAGGVQGATLGGLPDHVSIANSFSSSSLLKLAHATEESYRPHSRPTSYPSPSVTGPRAGLDSVPRVLESASRESLTRAGSSSPLNLLSRPATAVASERPGSSQSNASWRRAVYELPVY